MTKQKEIAINQIAYITHFKSYLDNILRLLTTPLGKFPPRNMMIEQLAGVLLPTEIGGSENFRYESRTPSVLTERIVTT